MKIVDPGTARQGGASDHRPGGIAFTYLLEGEESAAGNFSLMLVHVAKKYEAPRHRHNFDQVRVILEGSFGFGPGLVQERGSIGYFGEGTYYTQHGAGPSTTLLLQVAGASGSGYMSERQMRAGVQAVQARGEFHDGVFTWHDAAGKKHNQDGYEAVWEQVFGRPLRYAKPRYVGPVLMNPEHFGWVADPATPGLSTRHLGSFNEHGLGLSQWRLEPRAAASIDADGRRTLLYVSAGSARTSADDAAIEAGYAVELLADESLELRAGDAGLQMLCLALPRFSEARSLTDARST